MIIRYINTKYDIISAKENQATPEAAFGFQALLTSKQTAKQTGSTEGASLRVYNQAEENQATPEAAFGFEGEQ